ncbi:uncharacterized protein LOC142645102 [Dermatophagoides pteronyssinus]|uniref:uncharacterized protein LOC142645102 n=1 Tax=Dermatophagoides pteronyssinus TaxID=6956 RepID=UPI003F672805
MFRQYHQNDDTDNVQNPNNIIVPNINIAFYIHCKHSLVSASSASASSASSSFRNTFESVNHGDDHNIYNWSINLIEWKQSNENELFDLFENCQQTTTTTTTTTISPLMINSERKMPRKFNKNPLCQLMIKNFWECFRHPILQLCQQQSPSSSSLQSSSLPIIMLKVTFYKECDRQLFLSKLCMKNTIINNDYNVWNNNSHDNHDDDDDDDPPDYYLLQTDVGIFKITLCN